MEFRPLALHGAYEIKSDGEALRSLRVRQDLAQRLKRAVEEVGAATEFDYRVVNDRLDDAVKEIGAIIDGRRPRGRPSPEQSQLIDDVRRGLRT